MRTAALFSLAAAFLLVALALFYIGMNLPELNRNLERLSAVGDAATEQMPGMLEAVNRVEPHVSPLLDEVAASRLQVGQVVEEAAAYRAELPAVMARVDALASRLEAVQAQLPDVMTRMDGLLEESEAWRASVPDYLTRSEQLVAGARQAGKEASAGMVGGLISGTLGLPFKALANVGALIDRRSISARYLTDEDQANLRNAAVYMLQNPEQRLTSWSSAGSGHAGTVEVLESSSREDVVCHTLKISNLFHDGKSDMMKRKICKGAEGSWAVAK